MKNTLDVLMSRLRMKQLQLLIALDDHKSLHKASSAMAMTQSAASKALAELESMLEAPLFERAKSGLIPNPFGRCVVRYARVLAADLSSLCQEVAQIDARQRLALRLRRIDAHAEEVAVADHVGEHAQLADRAAALAFEARAGQAAFDHAALDQIVADIENVLCDRFEELRARFGRGFAIHVERGPCERARAVEVGERCAAECRFDGRAGRRIDGLDRAVRAENRFLTDEQVACKLHVVSSLR